MNNYERAFEWILKAEGGYINDLNDKGGETKYGISKRSYPKLDIKNLNKYDAECIYRKDYYDKCYCSKLPEKLALAVFDCAVNQGCHTAITLLQQAIGVHIDGIIGSNTLKAFETIDENKVLVNFMALRSVRYTLSGSFKEYGYGWNRRLFNLMEFIYER